MDDISEYRRRHREAYLRRVGSAPAQGGSGAPLDDGFGGSTSFRGPVAASPEPPDPLTDQRLTEMPLTDQPLTDQPLTDQPLSTVPLTDTPLTDKIKRDRSPSPVLDPDYASSLELARKLQREFDSLDEVRRPDASYKECLLSGAPGPVADESPDVELQKAIAKSLIDM